MSEDKTRISLEDLDRAPATLPAPPNFDFIEEYHKLHARFTTISDQLIQAKEDSITLRARTASSAVLDDLIKPFASRAFWFMCLYSTGVGLVLLLDGFHVGLFSLPDKVLEFLVGSTAVTVIGLVGMVLTGIFVGARPR